MFFGSKSPLTKFLFIISSEWYSDDCRNYEVQIFKEFESSRAVQSCYSVTKSFSGGGGASVPLKGATESSLQECSTFTKPAESFFWLLEVEAVVPAP